MTKLSPSGALEAGPLDLGSTDPGTSKLIGQHVGNYVIDRPLARGGMGAVFVAKHPRLGREVAVKFLDAEVSSRVELSQRFLSEAQVTASLNHPNIVDILDFGELEGRLYYVMELLRGQSLAAYMDERGRFSLNETLEVVRQICAALDAAHGAGVVHRDLKPANIIVLEGTPVRIKLVDFGVAKLMTTSEGHTRNGQVLGTPSHMAPEQAMGSIHLITPQTDLYSVGIIAYEMLTGAPPFQHESEFMLMIMHVRDPVPPLRERVGEIPEEIAQIIEGCLAKAPNDRPKSARELEARLRSALGNFSGDTNVVSELQPQAPTRQVREASTGFGATQADTGRDATEYDKSAVFPVSRAPNATLPDDGTLGISVQEAARSNKVTAAAQNTLRSEEDLGAKQRGAFAAVDATPKTLSSGKEPVRTTAAASGAVAESLRSAASASGAMAEPASLVVLNKGVPAPVEAPQVVAFARVEVPKEVALVVAGAPAPVIMEGASATNRSQTPDTLQSAGETVSGGETAQSTLSKLMARLQRKGDFPAFAQSVGEVSVKADANSAFSATQLGESILKDYALTAKLLRVINSTYGGRFGGKIYSIRHAIVLLGFDKIRSLALGISLFKSAGKGAQSEFVSDSAISSIVSGEIARAVAGDAKINDEEAMVCAMFRNLGRHLTIVYLPELFEQIQVVCHKDRVSERVAAERVMGLSFPKLGTAVAQNWHLPPGVIGAIAARSSSGPLTTSEDKANAVAEFSNELCEIVSTESTATRSMAIADLLAKHRRLLSLTEQDVMKLVTTVEDVFQQRYASVLGLDARASRFLTNVAAINAPQVQVVGPTDNAHVSVTVPTFNQAVPQIQDTIHDVAARARPTVAKLEFGKKVVPSDAKRRGAEPEKPLTPLEQAIEKLRTSLGTSPSDTILTQAFRLWSGHLGLKRLLLLVGTAARDELRVRAGLHEDLDALTKEFRISLKVPRGSSNVFHSAYTSVKDVVVGDVFLEQATAMVPQRYYEILGSPAFALYACGGKGRPPVLLLAHVDSAAQLPSPERLLDVVALRAVMAQAAAGR